MKNLKKSIAIAAFSFLILSLPAIASAQWRDRGGNDDYNGNRNAVALSYAVKNLRNTSRRFEDMLDRELDRTRNDGSSREDNLNQLAERFKNAAEDLEDEFDGAGSIRNSSDEARRVLDVGAQLDRALARSGVGRSATLSNYWDTIEKDLMTIAQAYNYSYAGSYGRNGGNRDDRGNDGNGRYNRNLRATIVNLKNKAKQFEKSISRDYDDRGDDRRRNNVNLQDLADRFKSATDDLEDRYDNRRDNGRSAEDARQVLQLGQQIGRVINRSRTSSRLQSEWRRIDQDLRILADAFNFAYTANDRRGNYPF